jgi:AMMECR1 domain-containing protein
MLNDVERGALIDLARRSVVAAVTGSASPGRLDVPLPDASGVFVTIKRRGELRGCLGTLQCHAASAAGLPAAPRTLRSRIRASHP